MLDLIFSEVALVEIRARKYGSIADMLNNSILLAVHFLTVVPLHAARSLWIATKLKFAP